MAQFENLCIVDFRSLGPYSFRMKKRPRDINQLGKLMVDIATGDVKDTEEVPTDPPEDEAERPLPYQPVIRLPRSVRSSSEAETTP